MGFDPGFLRTRFFAVAALVAALVLGGAAAAYLVADGFDAGSSASCDAVDVPGARIAAEPVVEDEGARRTYRWTIDAAAYRAGVASGCLSVGELLVEPSPDGRVHLEARVTADAAEAVQATRIAASFADEGGRLNVDVRELERGVARGGFRDEGAQVALVVRLPAQGAWDVRAANDVGDVRVSGLLVGNLTLESDVGDVRALDVDVSGDIDASSDVGSVVLSLASVQGGEIRAATDVDDIEIELPQRADLGYDVTAASDVGGVDVRIGETELYEREDRQVGGEVRARTRGFAEKPSQVTILARSDVGSVRVAVR